MQITVDMPYNSTLEPVRAAEPPPRSAPWDADRLLKWFLESGIVHEEEWGELSEEDRDTVSRTPVKQLLTQLMLYHLITPFQEGLLREGRGKELTIGQYRLLDLLGRGGMGSVYRAEHRYLRCPVAIKVLTGDAGPDSVLLQRFTMEARAVARLKHPNVVACLDAGHTEAKGRGGAASYYYVMEYVPGQDLHALVKGQGPLPVARATALMKQISDALAEAHRFGLIHRDIKPHNVLVTTDDKAKLLDFGLALNPRQQMTMPGVLLGTVGYMAPEQAKDASRVDVRADIFSLAATLFFAVTGKEPFPDTGEPISDLAKRINAPPPRIRDFRPELPPELDALLAKLMDPDPSVRFATAQSVSFALLPFTRDDGGARMSAPGLNGVLKRALLVEDNPETSCLMRELLEPEFECVQARDASKALETALLQEFDLAVVDQAMPDLNAPQLCCYLQGEGRETAPMILFLSNDASSSAIDPILYGADDFIQKPIRTSEFRSRVKSLMKKQSLQGNSSYQAIQSLAETVPFLPGRQGAMSEPLAQAEAVDPSLDPLTFLAIGVGHALEEAGTQSRGYHLRLPDYIRLLGEAVPNRGEYARLKDAAYIEMLKATAPLHDIGMSAIPNYFLVKPGALDSQERLTMQGHTIAGADILEGLRRRFGDKLPGMSLAGEIVRNHHERWDGEGYPDGMYGDQIPLSARVVALVSVYDALRSRRPHRAALTHGTAMRYILNESKGQFDPVLLEAFRAAASGFDGAFTSKGY